MCLTSSNLSTTKKQKKKEKKKKRRKERSGVNDEPWKTRLQIFFIVSLAGDVEVSIQ
jgi:hypothetical protein